MVTTIRSTVREKQAGRRRKMCTCFREQARTGVRSAGKKKPRPQNPNWVHELGPLYRPNGCYRGTKEYSVLFKVCVVFCFV